MTTKEEHQARGLCFVIGMISISAAVVIYCQSAIPGLLLFGATMLVAAFIP
jgi:hypothetical protein